MAVDVLTRGERVARRSKHGRGRIRTISLLALDVVAVPIAFAATRLVATKGPWDGVPLEARSLAALAAAGLAVLLIGASGGYGPIHGPRLAGRRRSWLIIAALVSVWGGIFLGAAGGQAVDVGQSVAAAVLLAAWWISARIFIDRIGVRTHRVLIVGSGSVGERVLEVVRRHPESRLEVVGYLDDQDAWASDGAPPYLGGIDDLEIVLDHGGIDRVIVSFSRRSDEAILRVLQRCDAYDVDVDIVPRLFELIGSRVHAKVLGGLPLVSVDSLCLSALQRCVKRAIDLVLSTVLIVLAFPAMACIAVGLLLEDGRPIFYRQARVGRNRRPFIILKFRTMVRDADQIGSNRIAALHRGELEIQDAVRLLKHAPDQRVTRLGRFLRGTSLDELPQLWNVLRGDMSLVGPRPLRAFEVDSLTNWQDTRHGVRPGITGLWQVLGRSVISWQERMELDYSYVRHWSLASDMRILAWTLPAVVRRRGAV
jgi:exopolysaccharide biosynthesis polyprenyl glycosylphosphotransferase